jgi:hypothetical protein
MEEWLSAKHGSYHLMRGFVSGFDFYCLQCKSGTPSSKEIGY